jgi:hypothetical protein
VLLTRRCGVTDEVRRREERRPIGAVGDPEQIALDAADEVALLVEAGPTAAASGTWK